MAMLLYVLGSLKDMLYSYLNFLKDILEIQTAIQYMAHQNFGGGL